jgi:hypothetical protein
MRGDTSERGMPALAVRVGARPKRIEIKTREGAYARGHAGIWGENGKDVKNKILGIGVQRVMKVNITNYSNRVTIDMGGLGVKKVKYRVDGWKIGA